ncbi:E3 ubiquitin-protein ligase [Sesamum angolense]|uniref:RBR-type E3 ubiquitin transferase n=1 Tax=Sesamum angolense TaxID=2727404 RepID=A0AAE1WAP0_9LAMI|nr:E3 ubiquitin-protein ligase [Sesamum angolense]
MNRTNISSSIAPSVLMFGLISDSGLASPVVCQPFSVRSSGLRKGRLAPLCGTKARHLALACTVYSLWRYQRKSSTETDSSTIRVDSEPRLTLTMSSRKGGAGGSRRGRSTAPYRQDNYQTEENWTLRPILDHKVQTQETSSSASTPEPFPGSQSMDKRRPQTGRNSRWAPRSRGANSRCVKDSEKEEEDLNGGSESRPELDSSSVKNGKKKLNLSNETDEDESIKRLEELRLSVDEPELSAEMLSTNKQLQEDEMLALESIYGENIFILEHKSGLKCFQAHIHIEVPKGIRVTAKLNSSGFHETRDDGSSDFSYSFQAGQEVIYQWVEWLQGCSLSYLGFDDEIILGPYVVRHDEDRRAISGSVTPDIDIPSMKSYNDAQRHENFCRNMQECCICLSEFAGSEFIRLPCQHFFSEKCMKTFSNMHMTEGTVLKLKCPEAKCDGMIPPGLLKRLLGEEEFERWESLTLQRSLESMADVVYCPRCETACLEDEDDHAQCSKCYYSFCTLCRERRHVGLACITPEMKLVILQAISGYEHFRDGNCELFPTEEIQRWEARMDAHQVAAVQQQMLLNNGHPCPNCGQHNVKKLKPTAGYCNHYIIEVVEE